MPEVIKPHPLYPDNSVKQARLEEAINIGYITRELLEDGNAKYTLTESGDLKWDLENIINGFMG